MTTRAAIFDGTPATMSLRDLPTPVPVSGETLIRVEACTLCASDRHTYEGRRHTPTPTVLGHEIVGRIATFGPETPRQDAAGRSLQIGDRVTWAVVAACGACAYCVRGVPQKCLRGVKYGHVALSSDRELRGGLAEHCLLAPGTAMVRLPETLPLAVVGPASCATATVMAALEAAQTSRPQRIGILGAGMLGLTACAAARSRGVEVIVCVDPAPERRDLAIAFGATHAIEPTEWSTTYRDATDGLGLDAVLELSGSPAAFEAGCAGLRIGGTLVLVGAVFPTPAVSVLPEQLVRRMLTLRGVHNYAPQHLVEAVEFLTTYGERYPFAGLVTQWHPLEAITDAFVAARAPSALRIGIEMAPR